jgi:hypothetical protein
VNDWQANRATALQILGTLNPDAYQARYAELLRGGLSASSIPEGPRSAESPLPGFDRFDTTLQHEHRDYDATWAELIKNCRRLESHENALLLVMGVQVPPYDEDDPRPYRKAMNEARSKAFEEMVDLEQGTRRFVCKNCGKTYKRTAVQRPRSGRCRACFDYWVAHGRGDNADAPLQVTERRKSVSSE